MSSALVGISSGLLAPGQAFRAPSGFDVGDTTIFDGHLVVIFQSNIFVIVMWWATADSGHVS